MKQHQAQILQRKMKKIKGEKTISKMTKKQRREYARLREQLRVLKTDKPKLKKRNPADKLWLAELDKETGMQIFKRKNETLIGVTPKEYAAFEKAIAKQKPARRKRKTKTVRSNKKVAAR